MLQVTNITGPSHKAPARLGSSGLSLLGAPGKWGRKKEKNSCLIYMLSGIASRVVCSPTVRRLKHDSCSLASPRTKVSERTTTTSKAENLGRRGRNCHFQEGL